MKKILIGILVLVLVLGLFYFKKSKFGDIKQIVSDVYSPASCNYNVDNRPYPSGKVPGSYLGLSEQEKQTALLKFVESKENPFNENIN